MKMLWIVLTAFLICAPYAVAGENLTYTDLINKLVDLERLSMLPAAGEKCQQWSSYNRASKYDAASGKYINWSANDDGAGFIRKEGNQFVLAEMEGPGVIWRIWSARPTEGHVKIYLDGAAEPAVDLPFEDYFSLQNKPFTYSALVNVVASGFNSYVPIPYQKSCKILAEEGWGEYYHFTYTTYPKDSVLPTFKREISASEEIAFNNVDKILSTCGSDPAGMRIGEMTEKKTVTVAPGKRSAVLQLEGPRAITALKVNMELPPHPDDFNILRELALRISWDYETKPSVWSPLGDFFGTAPGMNRYKSLPMGMTKEGFYSYWYMPFKKKASIELVNDGAKERTVSFTVTHAPLSQPIDRYGYFHVKWHRDAFLPDIPGRKEIDWTMLKTDGRGRFCGVMLYVWNPAGGWWGEGDEKIFINGEKFPSTFGTGSEDYFGYAWADASLFTGSYHNQTVNSGANRGHVSLNRWHICDNMAFQTSFEAAIEKYFPNNRPTLYSCTSYWYLAAGGQDLYQAAPVEERIGQWAVKLPLTLPDVGRRRNLGF
jgi:hypothetical protein